VGGRRRSSAGPPGLLISVVQRPARKACAESLVNSTSSSRISQLSNVDLRASLPDYVWLDNRWPGHASGGRVASVKRGYKGPTPVGRETLAATADTFSDRMGGREPNSAGERGRWSGTGRTETDSAVRNGKGTDAFSKPVPSATRPPLQRVCKIACPTEMSKCRCRGSARAWNPLGAKLGATRVPCCYAGRIPDCRSSAALARRHRAHRSSSPPPRLHPTRSGSPERAGGIGASGQ
jgi:hypothetical protein